MGGWRVVHRRIEKRLASRRHTSLVLDEQGHSRISTYDPGWRSLRLAWGEPFGAYMPLITLDH